MDVILNDEVLPILNRGINIPTAVAQFLDKAVAKKAKDRFLDAAEMRTAVGGLGA